jgi:hypothetical protein
MAYGLVDGYPSTKLHGIKSQKVYPSTELADVTSVTVVRTRAVHPLTVYMRMLCSVRSCVIIICVRPLFVLFIVQVNYIVALHSIKMPSFLMIWPVLSGHVCAFC